MRQGAEPPHMPPNVERPNDPHGAVIVVLIFALGVFAWALIQKVIQGAP